MQFCLIEPDAEFRKLLRHHIEVEWPDAVISEFDDLATATPETLTGSQALLVACPQPGQHGVDGLAGLFDRGKYPPVIVFASQGDELLAVDCIKAGAASYFPTERVTHKRLIETLRAELGTVARIERAERVGSKHQYRLLEELHSTDISTVYLAVADADPDRRLVVKLLRYVPDAGSDRVFDRFLQEYEIIAAIDHPNVATIVELGVADDHAFIVMEHLDGGRLSDRLERPVPPAQALAWVGEIASALAAVHAAGVLHRDLKPANIMFRSDGSLALIDFGLAKRMRLEAGLTGRGQIFGTPYYMSPEQGHGEATDERADIYSLGCIFYEMLTAKRPFTASTDMGVIYQHANLPRPLLRDGLAAYQPLLDKLLAARPDDRFPSARAVIAAVEALTEKSPDSQLTQRM